ncbi:hypothetical protein BKA80DRAFT_11128 [Phyllosticta citrichinensis]
MVGTARHPDPPHRSSALGKTHCLVHPLLSGSILAMWTHRWSRRLGTAHAERRVNPLASPTRRVGILASHGTCSQMAKVTRDFGRFGLCQTGTVLTFLPFYLFNPFFNTSPFVYLCAFSALPNQHTKRNRESPSSPVLSPLAATSRCFGIACVVLRWLNCWLAGRRVLPSARCRLALVFGLALSCFSPTYYLRTQDNDPRPCLFPFPFASRGGLETWRMRDNQICHRYRRWAWQRTSRLGC